MKYPASRVQNTDGQNSIHVGQVLERYDHLNLLKVSTLTLIDSFPLLWKNESFLKFTRSEVMEILRSVNERYCDARLVRDVVEFWMSRQDTNSENVLEAIEAMVCECVKPSMPPSYQDLFPDKVNTDEHHIHRTLDDGDGDDTIQSVFMATLSDEDKPQVVEITISKNGFTGLRELSQSNTKKESDIASCFSQGKMYFSGGDKHSRAFYSYNVATDAWEKHSSMSTQREKHKLVAVGSHIYVIGGFHGATSRSVTSIEKYDPLKDRWSKAGKMAVANWYVAAATYQNKIVMFGGRSMCEDESSAVQCFDTTTKQTTMLPNLPFPVGEAQITVSGNYAYIIPPTQSVIKYDMVNHTSSLLAYCIQRADFGVCRCGLPNQIYVFGGKGKNCDTINSLDEKTNTWSVCTKLPRKLSFVSACGAG